MTGPAAPVPAVSWLPTPGSGSAACSPSGGPGCPVICHSSRAMTWRAPATGMDSNAATKLPKKPPTLPPIDVPPRSGAHVCGPDLGGGCGLTGHLGRLARSGRRDPHVLLTLLWTRRPSVSAVVGERLGRPYRREAGAGAHAPSPTQAACLSSESGWKDLPTWRI